MTVVRVCAYEVVRDCRKFEKQWCYSLTSQFYPPFQNLSPTCKLEMRFFERKLRWYFLLHCYMLHALAILTSFMSIITDLILKFTMEENMLNDTWKCSFAGKDPIYVCIRTNKLYFCKWTKPVDECGKFDKQHAAQNPSWQTKSEGWGITLNAIYRIHLATTLVSGNQREKTATQNVQFTGTVWGRCLYRYVCNCFSVLFHVWGSAVRVRPPDKVPWSERQIRYTGLTSGLFKKGGAAIRTFHEAVLTSSKLTIYLNLIKYL